MSVHLNSRSATWLPASICSAFAFYDSSTDSDGTSERRKYPGGNGHQRQTPPREPEILAIRLATDVRVWVKSGLTALKSDFRCAPGSGHQETRSSCPKSANNGIRSVFESDCGSEAGTVMDTDIVADRYCWHDKQWKFVPPASKTHQPLAK
jgi:hypothetical protein